MTSTAHVYEVRPRKDQRGVDLISDALPFGRLWYEQAPNAISKDCTDTTTLASATSWEETGSTCVAVVPLVRPDCSSRLRSQDPVDGAMVVTGACESSL